MPIIFNTFNTFNTFQSVQPIAQYLKLREPLPNESLEDYRNFVADNDTDKVQAMEMRTGKPWKDFTDNDIIKLLGDL